MISLEEYRARGYVKAIHIGHCIFAVGLVALVFQCELVCAIGNTVAFVASIVHIRDSKKRIKDAERKLLGLGPPPVPKTMSFPTSPPM